MLKLAFLPQMGWPEILLILTVVLIFFGAKKLPEMARGLGQGIKEFKKATRDVQGDMHRAMEDVSPGEAYHRHSTPPPEPPASSPSSGDPESAPAASSKKRE